MFQNPYLADGCTNQMIDDWWGNEPSDEEISLQEASDKAEAEWKAVDDSYRDDFTMDEENEWGERYNQAEENFNYHYGELKSYWNRQ